jgi:hypothetical protein
MFSVNTNGDVVFCPCYAKLVIGNLERATVQGLWNSERLVAIREAFRRGVLPACCVGQLCPPVVGAMGACAPEPPE